LVVSQHLGSEEDDWKEIRVLNQSALHPFTKEKIPILVIENKVIDRSDRSMPFLGIPSQNKKHQIIAENAKIEPKTGLKLDRDGIMENLRNLKIGGYWTSANLKDWLISRQRYWGTPIPIVHCSSCGSVPVKDSDLPVELPILDSLSVKGKSPLLQDEEWLNVPCPNCGKPAKRETDTMDTFVDSSWYFARYLDPKNDQEVLSKEASKNLPVDLYIGGKEHATLHMYYARFLTHFMHQLGLSPVKEPFQSLLVQGMVKGKSYRIKGSGQYVSPSQVDAKKKVHIESGKPVIEDWEKMSKSKHNGVDPGEILKQYGSDTTKLLILSDVSPQSDRKWNPDDSHKRIENFQRKLWRLVHDVIYLQKADNLPELSQEEFQKQVHKCWDARNYYLRKCNNAYRETFGFAVVQASVQGLLGDLSGVHGKVKRDSGEFQRALGTAIMLLAPMAPHLCSELWKGLSVGLPVKHCHDFDWNKSLFHQTWPELDDNYNLKLNIKANGEIISEIPIAVWKFRSLEAEEAFNIACCDEKVQNSILSKDFQHEFSKVCDLESEINFKFYDDSKAAVTKESRKKDKEDKKEAKRLKLLKREEKKAKIEADIKAKMDKNQNDNSAK